jgi:phospholipase C
MMRPRIRLLLAASIAACAAIAPAIGDAGASASPPQTPQGTRSADVADEAFDHIVVIVEQDHTYDSYFRTYSPGATSTTHPGLWRLADNYVLFDNYFASSPGGTLGNMLEMMTGDSHDLLNSSKESLAALADLDAPTVFDSLDDVGIDWRIYTGDLANVDSAKVLDGSYVQPGEPVPASLYRAPVLGMRRTWQDPATVARIVDQDAFFDDANAGALPPVSFVFPSPSDHPGQGGSAGETRLLSLINAVQKSSQWDDTAVFVTWDDGGRQFDTAVPPVGSGQRVPLLLIAANARKGYISHAELDHRSLLELIQSRFGLASLGGPPAFDQPFDDAFDLLAPPREPMVLSRTQLPPTPVGTPVENQRTALLYVGGLLAALALAGVALFHQRQRVT